MFIETEDTPNPATLKFLPGRDVMGAGTADFTNALAAERSSLASTLFEQPGVARVFLGGDFIAVTKSDDVAWSELKPQVLAIIVDQFVSGRPLVDAGGDAAFEDVAPEDPGDRPSRSRSCWTPGCARRWPGDGGDIVFRGYRDGVVRLHMQGACAGCPSSRATLKHGGREHAAPLRPRRWSRSSRSRPDLHGSRDRPPMIDEAALDLLFRDARTPSGWTPAPVEQDTLRSLYDLLKLAPHLRQLLARPLRVPGLARQP